MFTVHGHLVPYSGDADEVPETVMNCGGTTGCKVCEAQTVNFLRGQWGDHPSLHLPRQR